MKHSDRVLDPRSTRHADPGSGGVLATRLIGPALLLMLSLQGTSCAGVLAQDQVVDGEDEASEECAWDVSAAPGEAREAVIDVREGTWMSLDVSPDGEQLAFDLLGDIYTLPIGGGEATPRLSGMAWEMQPRFSPDGKRIAFTSDRGGGDNIWTLELDGGEPQQVTNESFRLLNSPVWTPDGRMIAARKHFTSGRSLGAGEIWLYHASGSKGLQMTKRPGEQKDLGEPAFSPDGRYLYYSRDATPGSTFEYSKDSTGQIYRIERLDRGTGEIRTMAGGPGGACRPTPSPDGKWLAFVRRVRFQSTLFVLDLNSGEARAVYAPLERDMQETWAVHGVYPGMAWLPDSSEIVFYAKGGLWRVDPITGASSQIPFHVKTTRELREPVRFPVEVAPDHFGVKALRSVRVRPDGGEVVYQALGHLWRRGLPGGTPSLVELGADQFEFYPSYSRDGALLTYVSWNDRELGAVWVVGSDGREPRRLTQIKGQFTNPVFSPGGEEVYFTKVAGGSLTSPLWSYETGVYRVAVAGGPAELVTRSGSEPMFGADPDELLLTRSEWKGDHAERQLVAHRLSDGRETTLFNSQNGVEWNVSPNGQWLAFSERYKATVVPFVRSGRPVALSPGMESMPSTRVSEDAGENLQFSGDSMRLHWSLGPELFSRDLSQSFAFLEGAPKELPEPETQGLNISFRADYAKASNAYALVGARIITMQGDRVIEHGTLIVAGDRIQALGDSAEVLVPKGMPKIDCQGATLMPGMLDVHAHGSMAQAGITPQNNWQQQANLAFGVTTIHDPSNDTNSIFSAAELAKAGLLLMPRIYSTGTILYGAAGSFKAEVDSVDDALHHLRRLKAVGAISVKSYNQPRREQRQQVLEAARQLKMMVVPEGGSLLQHNLTMVVDGHTGIEHTLPVEKVYTDVLQLWGSTPVGYTPTHIVCYGGLWGENYWYQHLNVWENERLMNFVPRSRVDPRARRRTMAPDADYNHLRAASIAKDLVRAGGRVQLGAHGQLPGYGAHWELWMFVQGGMTELEALRAATLDGAKYLGMDADLGSLEAGKLADILVLDANPLEDIQNSETIRYTLLGGRLLDAHTLAEIDPTTGARGPAPDYFWRGLESGIGYDRAAPSCSCGAH